MPALRASPSERAALPARLCLDGRWGAYAPEGLQRPWRSLLWSRRTWWCKRQRSDVRV